MRKNLPTGTELDLLKTEIPLLASKVSSVVDTLWKIRTASITIWTAVLGVGLGAFTNGKDPVLTLLVLSCLLPIAFLAIDARNNRWYRRVSSREYAIQQYLNDPAFEGPEPFPIYDIAGVNTFRGSRTHAWQFSLTRSLIDPIPLSVYGGQLLFSAVACTIYMPAVYRWCALSTVVVLVEALVIYAVIARRSLSRQC